MNRWKPRPGSSPLEDIKGLADLLEKGFIEPQRERVSLYVNNTPIALSSFPKQIISNILLALASSLKGVKEVKKPGDFPEEEIPVNITLIPSCPIPPPHAKIGRGFILRKTRRRVTPANEVHLRQLTVDEALFKLDQYLNDAFMAGLLPGKDNSRQGNGHPAPGSPRKSGTAPSGKSYRPAGYGEGGEGVTIVELAQR